MLYVSLFFAPKILKTKASAMREVVDKHFNDNWIITLYMGWVVNLRDDWAPYKAANAAMKNTLKMDHVVYTFCILHSFIPQAVPFTKLELARDHVQKFKECEQVLMVILNFHACRVTHFHTF